MSTAADRVQARGRLTTRGLGLAAALAVLVAVAALSIAVGTKSIPLGTVLDVLLARSVSSPDTRIIGELRIPRTLIGLAAGVALGLAGALMQALTATRSPTRASSASTPVRPPRSCSPSGCSVSGR